MFKTAPSTHNPAAHARTERVLPQFRALAQFHEHLRKQFRQAFFIVFRKAHNGDMMQPNLIFLSERGPFSGHCDQIKIRRNRRVIVDVTG